MAEAMSEERLALIGEWIEKVAPHEAYYGSMQRFMHELLAEVSRLRGPNSPAERLRAYAGHDRIRALGEQLAEANRRAASAERELAELGRVEYEIGIQQPGEDDATQHCGFSEADVRARAAEQGATYVERVCRRGKWKVADRG